MDLIAISRLIWRFKFFTLPVILLTIAAGGYVMSGKKPVYEATASLILTSPPAPPTAQQIAENPELKKVNAVNPYANLGGPVVADVLSRKLSTDPARDALARQGADTRYTVMPSMQLGWSSPIVQITG